MPQIIPITDLRDTNKIAEMCAISQEPIFVTKNGYGSMVIMSMEAYEQSQDEKFIFEGLRQIREGKGRDGETVMRELLLKHE